MQLNKHKTTLDLVAVNRLGFNSLMRVQTNPFHRGTMLILSTKTTFT